MRDKIIRIYWNKATLIEDAIYSENAHSQGIYYITRVFGGKEKSLYIGEAAGNNTIKNRLQEHNRLWLPEYRGQIYVRIGEIIYPRDYDDEIIKQAEKVLIYEHRDILSDNTVNTKSYSYYELYRIENEGIFLN